MDRTRSERTRRQVATRRFTRPAAVAALTLLALAAQAAQIRGRLVNPDTGKPVGGAEVRVEGTQARATTDADGRFHIENVPAGSQTLLISGGGAREQRTPVTSSEAGAPPIEIAVRAVQQLERIVISGIRAAEIASVAAKREADTQIEAVSADEAGKLVDKNVADAVARLPGVSTATDKGEGRYVVIRGLEPALANVTINNQTSASPEPESRQVKLDDVPAALIGEVTVVKVLTADRDANAIAGQVNIKTLTAFDRPGNFASARIAGVQGSLHDDKGREGDITVGGKFGPDKQFGAVLSYTRSKRPSTSEDVIATGDVAWQSIAGIEVPESLDSRIYQPAFRTREGTVANFDWQPNADTKAYVRLTHSKFDDEEVRNRFRFLFPTAASGYTNLTATSGDITGTRGERYVRVREEVTETRTGTVGLELRRGDDVLTVEGSVTKADKEDPTRAEFRYRTGSSALPGSYLLGDTLFDLALTERSYDPARFNLNTFRDQVRHATEELKQARIDYQWARDAWGQGSYLKFGAKHLDRKKLNDQSGTSYVYNGPARSLASDTGGNLGGYFGRYTFGPAVSYDSALAFFNANPGLFGIDQEASFADALAADYSIREKISAAYLMASVTRGSLVVTPGLRVERTEADYKAIAVTQNSSLTDGYNSFGSSRYTDWFPSLAARWDLSRSVVARASVTTAIGRPDYDKVAPTISVSVDDNEVTKGNSSLKPLMAVNLDASLEHYLPGGGLLAAAIFHKKIDDPIFVSTRTASGTFAGVALVDAIVVEPINGDRSKLTGLELNYQQPFTFLPAPFDGLGAGVNLTFVRGDMRVPGRPDKLPLVLQAERMANLQLYYEKFGLQARLAYNWRSEMLEFVGEDARNDIYIDRNGTLSLKVAYELFKGLQVFFEGTNLNQEEDYRYAASRNRMVEAERFGRTYRLGLSYSF
jgi:TonB-dependent receptor